MIDGLTYFYRDNNIEKKADIAEQLGNFGLGLLRIGFGKTVYVKKNSPDSIEYTEYVHSTAHRIAAIALFVLAFPLTIPLALLGRVGLGVSKSYGRMFYAYLHLQPKQAAAIKIQKIVRGYQARKAFLSRDHYPQYRSVCSKITTQPASTPTATGGRTTVYLPPEMGEIVLKDSGRRPAIKRFQQMQEVRSILQAQHSSHLIIPKANLYTHFLVEQRLPINVDSYCNMALYLGEPKLFDAAVRELTRLFSKMFLADIVGHQLLPLGHLPGVGDYVRYDNIPLFIVEKDGTRQGCVGLIDLEHMEGSPNPKGLATLARIFPLHVDLIAQEARKLHMGVDDVALRAAAERGRIYLKLGYTDHLEWLKQKGAPYPFTVGPERKEELIRLLEKEVLTLNQGINGLYARKRYLNYYPPKNFIVGNPAEVAKELAEKSVPAILKSLEEILERQYQNISMQEMSDPQLVRQRSVVVKRTELSEQVESLIKNSQIKFESLSNMCRKEVAEQLAHVVVEELVKGGEMYYFDPAYYSGGHDLCWLRY